MREMKNSGIAWIGEIPSEWKVCKLLNLLRKPITDGPHETPVLQDIGIPFISVDSLNDSENIDFSKVKKFISDDLYEEYSKKTILEENDILFTKAATIGKTAIVKKDKFMVWSPLAILKCNNSISYYRYVYHLMNCQLLIDDVILHGSNNTQINVGMRELEKINTPLPPLAEQQSIASFLDNKCSEIDTLISLQEEMISELQAYKQSVITEAVTKGLTPNVPIKDSGVEWIGEIPEKWIVKPFKSIYITTKGLNITKADLVEKGIPVLSYGQIHSKENPGTQINDLLFRFVPDTYITTAPECLVQKGCFLIADTSEDREGCGNAIYVDRDMILFAGYHTIIAKPIIEGDNKYLAYLFLTDYWRQQIRSKVSGIKVFSVNQKHIRATSVILPPKSEQIQIVEYLDEKTTQIDSLIAIKREKIEELKDYKKSIIYEYVTGKKRVI